MDSQRTLLAGRLGFSAAHEIVNPLSAVLNTAALMEHLVKEGRNSSDRRSELHGYLSQIIQETSRAGRLASELLAFSRPPGRKTGRANLNEIVDRTLSLASHFMKVADVGCESRLTDDLPVIWCDRHRLQQAILNILVNAVDAVSDGPARSIMVATRKAPDGRGVILEIKDTGTGILPKDMPHIFEPFFTTRNSPECPGLGLTVSRLIVEEHAGDLQVWSDQQSGTTVTIALPTGHADSAIPGGAGSRGKG